MYIKFNNFNSFENFNKKENSIKFILLGILLLIVGIVSFFYKGVGIKLVSWSLGAILLFISYLNLKNINELRRYASKSEISPYIRIQTIMLISALLLFIFPKDVQSIVSIMFGIYLLINQLKRVFNRNYIFGVWDTIKLLFGIFLIFSPLFISSFIASIMSFIVILIGVKLISYGNYLKSF